MNGAFSNLLKFRKLASVSSLGSETYFVRLIACQIFICFSNVFEVLKHFKQYRQKCFFTIMFCFVSHKSIKIFN